MSNLKFIPVMIYNALGRGSKVEGQYEVFLDGRPMGEVEKDGNRWRAWTPCGGCTNMHLLPGTFKTRRAAAEALDE